MLMNEPASFIKSYREKVNQSVRELKGIHKIHSNRQIPIKRKKKPPLATIDKKSNRQLAKVRCAIEHVNRRGKIFRVVKAVYRGKHQHYSKTWNLIAGWVNWRYSPV